MRAIATNRRVDRAALEDFIRPRHHGVLITIRGSGRPQSSLVTLGLDLSGRIVVSSYPERAKVTNLRRNPAASMLGKFQKQWLLNKLKNSTATFKVLVSSVPWAKGTKPGSLDTWDGHPQEREEIFQFIEKNRVEGIVLLSADRHRSDAWRIERPYGYNFYEFESSKLTNIHTHKVMPKALFGYNKKCSVGLLEFDTTRDDPQVSYRILSIDNEEVYRRTVFKSDLSFKKK